MQAKHLLLLKQQKEFEEMIHKQKLKYSNSNSRNPSPIQEMESAFETEQLVIEVKPVEVIESDKIDSSNTSMGKS